MLATYGAALLIVVSSLFVGRAFFAVLGRRETLWLETPVGLAVLIVVCSVLTRVPGRATTSLIGCGVLVVASVLYLRLSFVDSESFLMGGPVAALTLLLASLPFIASGHIGIPGVGVNNDMASHLIWADWLQDPEGPTPFGISNGYPLGPHGLVATVAKLLGTEPLYGFLGLLLALPVITALTSLNVLGALSPVRRTVGALLVALAYLSASTFGIAGFKELALSAFLLAYTLSLRAITREPDGKFPLIAALGVLLVAMIATFSYPGVIWPAAVTGVWIVFELIRARQEDRMEEVRANVRRAAPVLIGAGVVLLALLATQIPRLIDFYDSGIVGDVRGTDSKLRFPLSPLEALGSWPSGEFLFGKSSLGLEHWQIFGAIGVIALVVGMAWWFRHGDLALPAGVVAAGIIYLGALAEGGRYVQAKALVIPAAVIMLLIVGGLLAQQGGRGRMLVAIPFVLIAAFSSFLALRDSVIAPTDRFEELKDLRGEVAGQSVLALTSDRFTDYGLRDSEVYSPAKNAERQVPSQVTKEFRLPVDFDSVDNKVLNQFPFAVTTSAPYQSKPPPGWTVAKSTNAYRLWKRTGTTPPISVLYEEARPGRVFRCQNPKLSAFLSAGGTAVVWPRPVIAKRLYWIRDGEEDSSLKPGQSASQPIKLPAGRWDLSIQYSSPVAGIEIEAPGLDAHLPAGVEAAIPFRPEEGPYWPVGTVESDGGEITITVKADQLSRLKRALGVDAPANIGNVTAVATQGVHAQALASTCGLYIDHILNAQQTTDATHSRRPLGRAGAD